MPRFVLLWLFALTLAGCEGFFGSRTPTDFLEVPLFDNRQVAYVPIQPAITGLSRPVDVIAGYDELIYVADAGSSEVIAYDQAGIEQGRMSIPGLQAIAQDRRLNLLAVGRLDTTVAGLSFSLPAIYRINLNPGGKYGIQHAIITQKIVHPFYFRSSVNSADTRVRFEGIDALADNRYYVSRSGSSNSPQQFGGPDDAVLLFDAQDRFTTPVAVTTELGLFTDYFKAPRGLATQAKPPQSPAVNRDGSFAVAMAGPDLSLRVQRIQFVENDAGALFRLFPLQPLDTSRAGGALYTAGRFENPTDVTFSGDGTNYLFVVDAAKDSLYLFNNLGYEGVQPPPGSGSRKAVNVSFGGRGQGLTQFNEPRAVAYLNRILYVADAGNGRLLRFRLTTDFQ